MIQAKQIGASLLLVLLLVKAMIVPALFVNYELRKDFIIKNYCVNKGFPELHCDGKCYLAKQIKAAKQEQEKQAQSTFLDKLLGFEGIQKESFYAFDNPEFSFLEKPSANFQYQMFTGTLFGKGVFHPPQFNV